MNRASIDFGALFQFYKFQIQYLLSINLKPPINKSKQKFGFMFYCRMSKKKAIFKFSSVPQGHLVLFALAKLTYEG